MGAERLAVKRLSITAPGRDSLRALLPELEDAFRTTDWHRSARSGGSAGLLQVRRLDLGVLQGGLRRADLSRRLADLAARLEFVPGSAAQPVPETAEVLVWPGKGEQIAAAFRAVRRTGSTPWWLLGLTGGVPGATSVDKVRARAEREVDAREPEFLALLVLRLCELDLTADALHLCESRGPAAAERLGVAPQVARRRTVPTEAAPAAGRAKARLPSREILQGTRAARALNRALTPAARRALYILSRDAGAGSAPLVALSAVLVALHRGRTSLAECLKPRQVRASPAHPLAPVRDLPVQDATTTRPAGAARGAATDTSETVADMPSARQGTRTWTDGSAPSIPAPFAAREADDVTRAGGLVQLVRLIALAGGQELDDALAVPLSLRVLRAFLGRLAPEDGLLRAVPDPLTWEEAPHCEPAVCTVSATCFNALPGRFRIRRLEGAPGLRVIAPSRGSGIVAVVDRDLLSALRARLGEGRFRLSAEPLACAGLGPALQQGMQLGVQWLAISLLRTGWRGVLSRPAYLSATGTHIDITADLDAVRLAERRAGLDLSPGWVPWLSRVLMLTYERFDKPDPGWSSERPA